MVTATQQDEIRERRRAAVRPVADVVALHEPTRAARKAARVVSVLQRPPQRGRNRAGPSPYFHDPAIGIVSHDHTARVARQPLGRFRGNVRAALEDRLAGRVGVGQHGRIDVDDHLIALAGSAGIDAVVEGRLREQRQGVGLLLIHSGRFRGNVHRRIVECPAGLFVQGLARGSQGLQKQHAGLWCQLPSDGHHAVIALINLQPAAHVTLPVLGHLGLAVHPAPAAHDALDVLGGAGAPDGEQPLLGLGRGHAAQRADLEIGELTPREGCR